MNATLTLSHTVTRLQTRKDARGQTRLDIREDTRPLPDDEILLKVTRFAVTTNNITYAAFGDAMQYWQFFPAGNEAWGHMPVWGFADVVRSRIPGIAVGERFYGYLPIASHVRMKPVRVTQRGFYDGCEHRQALTSAYNQYARCSADPVYAPALENYQALLRPLFITSFMLGDFLRDNGYFGATRLVFSSASSKTALGTAYCMMDDHDVDMLALTSTRNRAFVENLGCYRKTYTYDDLEQMPADRPTLYVDFSGDEDLRSRIHRHLGAALVYDCLAGSTQNSEFLRKSQLPGPQPKFYFAPTQIRKRNRDWGPQEVTKRFNDAQMRFIDHLHAAGKEWLDVIESRGFSAAQRVIEDLYAGRSEPRLGHIVRLE